MAHIRTLEGWEPLPLVDSTLDTNAFFLEMYGTINCQNHPCCGPPAASIQGSVIRTCKSGSFGDLQHS